MFLSEIVRKQKMLIEVYYRFRSIMAFRACLLCTPTTLSTALPGSLTARDEGR